MTYFYASLLFLFFKTPKKVSHNSLKKKCNFLKIKNWEDFDIRYWCHFMPDSLKAGTVGYFSFAFNLFFISYLLKRLNRNERP